MFHDGQIKEAADYLERSTDPESPKRTEPGVWRILAKAQNRSGRFDNAQRTGQLLLKQQQEPRWKADAYLDLAEAQLGLQNLTDALDSVEKGLALNAPGAHIAGLHLIRGEVALHQQQWTGALDEFKKTITMVPDDPLLQPRALHGASIAAEKSAEAELANDYKAKLKAGFPKWVPTIKLTEPAKQ
jgi:tetratricopeptide (TPR) repeat protein